MHHYPAGAAVQWPHCYSIVGQPGSRFPRYKLAESTREKQKFAESDSTETRVRILLRKFTETKGGTHK